MVQLIAILCTFMDAFIWESKWFGREAIIRLILQMGKVKWLAQGQGRISPGATGRRPGSLPPSLSVPGTLVVILHLRILTSQQLSPFISGRKKNKNLYLACPSAEVSILCCFSWPTGKSECHAPLPSPIPLLLPHAQAGPRVLVSPLGGAEAPRSQDHLEGWDREGGREGDARGKRYGDICIRITDSLCYKAETNTPL